VERQINHPCEKKRDRHVIVDCSLSVHLDKGQQQGKGIKKRKIRDQILDVERIRKSRQEPKARTLKKRQWNTEQRKTDVDNGGNKRQSKYQHRWGREDLNLSENREGKYWHLERRIRERGGGQGLEAELGPAGNKDVKIMNEKENNYI
jgi:hypothetical protein